MDEMMKAQFTEAKALIQQGRYQNARVDIAYYLSS